MRLDIYHIFVTFTKVCKKTKKHVLLIGKKCSLGTIFVEKWWSKKYKETWGGGNEGVVEIRVKGAL